MHQIRRPAGAARAGEIIANALSGVIGAVLVAAVFLLVRADRTAASTPAPAIATYVGTATCASCHAKEHDAWRGSHHDRAMEVAGETTTLGDFGGAQFSHAGVTSRFFRRDDRWFVNTDGPGSTLADFEIKYTFGFYPLQQYLVELPGGRLQALGIAWDARPKAQGGQRWFHLYPALELAAGDPLHWTGIDQNWNSQCADCHSTNLRKHYDDTTRTYRTTWSEIDVACEACHGPGSSHVAWAKLGAAAPQGDMTKGLVVALDERRGVTWAIDAVTGNAARSSPRTSNREIETCARCHSRRGQFDDTWHPGPPLGNAYRVATIEPGLYHVDGQMRDEVYNHGSFLQSRMYAKGVTCSDCHEPHSQKLRAPGNAVCGQCHAPVHFDAASHHRHKPGSPGADCAACHMRTTTFMVIDPRHDHGFRIPRPDRTLSLGVPNACNQCHADKTTAWVAAAVKSWFPQPMPGFQTFAESFAKAERGAPGSAGALAAVADDRRQPGFVRASAILRLGHHLNAATLPVVRSALGDADAQVRAAAVAVLSHVDPDMRAQLLARLLGDPLREVRMSAARALAGAPEKRLAPHHRAAFEAALAEYVAAEHFNADRPESRANLGNLYAAQGKYDAAMQSFRYALALDPSFIAAALNLADLQRGLGQEDEAEKTLRAALQRDPHSAAVHFALGLSLVRQQRRAEALQSLAEAARLDPASPRFAYVHAVALNDTGRGTQARAVLEAALQRHPFDRDLLLALALFERDAGQRQRALGLAQRLAEVDPDDPDASGLVRELSGGSR